MALEAPNRRSLPIYRRLWRREALCSRGRWSEVAIIRELFRPRRSRRRAASTLELDDLRFTRCHSRGEIAEGPSPRRQPSNTHTKKKKKTSQILHSTAAQSSPAKRISRARSPAALAQRRIAYCALGDRQTTKSSIRLMRSIKRRGTRPAKPVASVVSANSASRRGVRDALAHLGHRQTRKKRQTARGVANEGKFVLYTHKRPAATSTRTRPAARDKAVEPFATADSSLYLLAGASCFPFLSFTSLPFLQLSRAFLFRRV